MVPPRQPDRPSRRCKRRRVGQSLTLESGRQLNRCSTGKPQRWHRSAERLGQNDGHKPRFRWQQLLPRRSVATFELFSPLIETRRGNTFPLTKLDGGKIAEVESLHPASPKFTAGGIRGSRHDGLRVRENKPRNLPPPRIMPPPNAYPRRSDKVKTRSVNWSRGPAALLRVTRRFVTVREVPATASILIIASGFPSLYPSRCRLHWMTHQFSPRPLRCRELLINLEVLKQRSVKSNVFCGRFLWRRLVFPLNSKDQSPRLGAG